jgi:hypothetical protein
MSNISVLAVQRAGSLLHEADLISVDSFERKSVLSQTVRSSAKQVSHEVSHKIIEPTWESLCVGGRPCVLLLRLWLSGGGS